MRLEFSLPRLLIYLAVYAATWTACAKIDVYGQEVGYVLFDGMQVGSIIRMGYSCWDCYYPPHGDQIASRIMWAEPVSLTATMLLIEAIRRCRRTAARPAPE